MLICPEASSAQNNIAAVSADGSTVWVLIRRLNSSCRRSIAFVVLALRHWVGGRRVKVKRRSAAFETRHLPKRAIPDGARPVQFSRRAAQEVEVDAAVTRIGFQPPPRFEAAA